jgi:hypothetical protein
MLTEAKHLSILTNYEIEILRLRLRMTFKHSLEGKEGTIYRMLPFSTETPLGAAVRAERKKEVRSRTFS